MSQVHGKTSTGAFVPLLLDSQGRVLLSGLVAVNPVAGFSGNAAGLRNEASNNGIAYPVAVAEMQTDGAGNLVGRRAESVYKTAQGTAVATAGEVVVWAPAGGKKVRVMGCVLGASVAGRYELRDGATVIAYLRLAANTPLCLYFGQGKLAPAADTTLRLRNVTGGPADMDAAAWGTEE